MKILVKLTKGLPKGTNLALLQFLWMLVSGALLPQRGALFPALKSIGLSDAATRRAWAAFRGGVWQMGALLRIWQAHIQGLPGWKERRYEGYRVVTADITAFWRPALKECPSKHYHPTANRALPAVIFGIVGVVGEIGGQRVACPRAFERVDPKDTSEKRLWQEVIKQVKGTLAEDEILAVDAGVKISQLQAGKIDVYVLRLAGNFTARRNYPAVSSDKGRPPVYGERIRPLERTYKGKTIAKSTPDRVETWVEDGVEMRAEIWDDLILPDVIPGKEVKTFHVYAIYNPAYEKPWLLASPVKLKAESIKAIYQDRWPVEQIPLAAKQMVGAHRQFVHNEESIQRLPELALLAGSILSFLAATSAAVPTGFWDRHPKRTPGRFRRMLMGKPFPQSYQLPEQIREKASATAHLPKGNLARQQKQVQTTPVLTT
jgi:hypothetical protein